MSQAKIFEENILGGGNQQFVGEQKEKHYKRKRNEEQRVRGERRREKEKKKKPSCLNFFAVFRRQEFSSPRIKVGLLDESCE